MGGRDLQAPLGRGHWCPVRTWGPAGVPLLNRIGSGSQTWVAVAVARPALFALALLAFALCAGDYLPGLPAELAPPLDNGLGLMLMPAVAASAALPPVLWSHAQHADAAPAGRGDRDRASRALPRPARPRVRSRRHRASHGGTRRSGRRGSRAHLDPCDPGIRASRLLASRLMRQRRRAVMPPSPTPRAGEMSG